MYGTKWDFELPAAYRSMEDTLEKINQNLRLSMSSWNQIVESVPKACEITGPMLAVKALTAALENAPKLNESLFTATNLISKHLEKMVELSTKLNPSFLTMTEAANKWARVHDHQIPEIDWDWMADELEAYDADEVEKSSDLITPELCEELEESIISLVSDPAQAQETVKSRFVRWKEQHPILAFVFLNLLAAYVINVLSGLTNDYLSGNLLKPANMYEEPTSTSSVVINVDVDQNVTIIDSVRYYYEVVCTDPETGEQFVGYIYKPNVSVEPTDATTATVPVEDQEGTMPTESIPSESVPENNE